MDGKKQVVFDLTKIPKTPGNQLLTPNVVDYAPLDDGGAAILTQWVKRTQVKHYSVQTVQFYSIAIFDPDGNYQWSIKPDLAIQPFHIAAFNSGDFLIVGEVRPKEGMGALEIVIIDDVGKIIARHTIPKVDTPKIAAMKGAPGSPSSATGNMNSAPSKETLSTTSDSPEQTLDKAASEFRTDSGDDNFIYMADPDNPKVVLRVSHSGKIDRISLISTRKANEGPIKLLGLIESQNQLVYQYGILDPAKSKSGIFRMTRFGFDVYDIYNGAILASYATTPEQRFGSMMIGFHPGDFYFLQYLSSSPIPKYSIIHAAP